MNSLGGTLVHEIMERDTGEEFSALNDTLTVPWALASSLRFVFCLGKRDNFCLLS